MMMFIFNIFGLFGVSQAFLHAGPDICVSEDESLNCFCKDRENITISANINFDVKHIIVDGCGSVTVPLGALTHLQLDKISFIDIIRLEIRPFALVGVQTIHTLRIEDIQDFKVMQHGFVGLFNITNVIIRNVSASAMLMSSFGGVSNVQNFFIGDSNFGEIQETAFIVTNVTRFNLVNCQIRYAESIAFLVHNAEEVVFENCDFHKISNHSFTLAFIDVLSFLNCRFGVIPSATFYTKSIKVFNFRNCSVSELEPDAFSYINVSNKITFNHNVIKIANEYSLFPATVLSDSNDVDIDDCCNSFTCDCNIYWLWSSPEDALYKSLLENSFCIERPEVNLSSLVPVLDSFGNCKTLELKIFNPESKIKAITSRMQNTGLRIKPAIFLTTLIAFLWHIIPILIL